MQNTVRQWSIDPFDLTVQRLTWAAGDHLKPPGTAGLPTRSRAAGAPPALTIGLEISGRRDLIPNRCSLMAP
jgi:hypothetical protein